MRTEATFRHACAVLEMIQGRLTGDQVDTLRSYLPTLIDEVRRGNLPAVTQFARSLQPTVDNFPVIAQGFNKICLDKETYLQLLMSVESLGIEIESADGYHHNNLLGAMSDRPTFFREEATWDVVKVTPRMLGIDTILLEGTYTLSGGAAVFRMDDELTMAYVDYRAREYGLELFCDEAILRFCLEDKVKEYYKFVVATERAFNGGPTVWINFSTVERCRDGRRIIGFKKNLIRYDTEILFLRRVTSNQTE